MSNTQTNNQSVYQSVYQQVQQQMKEETESEHETEQDHESEEDNQENDKENKIFENEEKNDEDDEDEELFYELEKKHDQVMKNIEQKISLRSSDKQRLETEITSIKEQIASFTKRELKLYEQQREAYQVINSKKDYVAHEIYETLANNAQKIEAIRAQLDPIQSTLMTEPKEKADIFGLTQDKKTASEFHNKETLQLQAEINKIKEHDKKLEKDLVANWKRRAMLRLSDFKGSIEEVQAEIKQLQSKIPKLTEEIKNLPNLINVLKKMESREKWRMQYLRYAIDNKVNVDLGIDKEKKTINYGSDHILDELFKSCNNHRQHFLMYVQNKGKGHNESTRCWKFHYDYSKYQKNDCDGFWTGKHGCACTDQGENNYHWSTSQFDPLDFKEFNITHDTPFGELYGGFGY